MKQSKRLFALILVARWLAGIQDVAGQSLHQLGALTIHSNASAQLALNGSAPSLFVNYFDLYPIEASTNLRDWTPLGTALRTNSSTLPLSFLDPEAGGFDGRFYRTPTNHLITALPKPTGPYPVGRIDRLLMDSNRPDRLPFMISIWYPAAPLSGVLPGVLLDTELGTDAYYFGSGYTFIFQACRGHAVPSAPVAAAPAPFPVLIYSPGYGGLRTENADKTENLASHGFVVVGIDHPDSYASVQPDRRIVQGGRPAALFQDLEHRASDVRFVFDELGRLQASDPLLAGRLAMRRVGLFGWSFGGITSLELCATDLRFNAAATLDGGAGLLGIPEPLGLAFNKPVLIMSGDVIEGPGQAEIRRVLRSFFDKLTHLDAYWMRVVGTVHGDFAAFPWFYSPTTPAKTQAALTMRDYLVSFFNKYLNGQDDHLLDRPSAAYPAANPFLRSALTLLTQPQSLDVRRGSNATLRVLAVSPFPVHYQWQLNGADIPDATGTNLAVLNAQSNHVGTYTVQVEDGLSALSTQPAMLDVGDPPVIVLNLTNQTVAVGGTVTFVVTVTGTPPFGYEWRKGSLTVATNTVSQTTGTYTIPNVRSSDAGLWRAVVRNKFNLLNSANSAATLTVQ